MLMRRSRIWAASMLTVARGAVLQAVLGVRVSAIESLDCFVAMLPVAHIDGEVHRLVESE